jgi:tRNA-splicing ligase RtcB
MKVITGKSGQLVPIKAWVDGVELEDAAEQQLVNVSTLPFVWPHLAVMPDVHAGFGATVGSVIPTDRVIIPAAVGVDIGCGMMARRLDLKLSQLPDNLAALRSAIEKAVPHGRTDNGGRNDRGAWGDPPQVVRDFWGTLEERYKKIVEKYPALNRGSTTGQLGTLGSGNHFIEVCGDENQDVWIMLHSGSRGVGNRIGSHFIAMAKKEMERWHINVPDKDLSYLAEGSEHYQAYIEAVRFGQDFARLNREVMMLATLGAVKAELGCDWDIGAPAVEAVNCHHNYVSSERHYGRKLWVTRKGAVSAQEGELGIIPGSMGAKSFIVRGKGNRESLCSCSHGAGRRMSRTQAKKEFTVADHVKATEGVECRKDESVIDETPAAYKSIDAVMAAQSDLVDVVHTLKQVLCVKG